MEIIDAINALSVLKASKQQELDAISLAVSVLDGTWQGQYQALEDEKVKNADLQAQVDDFNTKLATDTPSPAPAETITP